MRLRHILPLLLLLSCASVAQPLPSPAFQSLTVSGSVNAGTLQSAGLGNLLGGGQFTGSFSGPMTMTGLRPVMQSFTTATLPTPISKGDIVWVSDCLNGTQTVGNGTGCLYTVDDSNTWVPVPSVSTLSVTVGGQALRLAGASSTANQGNGPRIQLAGTTVGVASQCAQFDNSLNIVPSGGPCGGGGGGGSGTVTTGSLNQLAYYSAAGTTIAPLAGPVNNAVLVTSGGGVPSQSTTLPSGLTIPTPTISTPNITGTMSAVTANLTGKLTTVASAVGAAGLNVPQGTAPGAPANGDVWGTTAGLFARYNGGTVGPFIGLANHSASAPLVYNSGTGAFTCPTCATSTSGGALSAVAPIALSAGGAISLGTIIGAAEFFTDSSGTVVNATYPLPVDTWPWATGTLDSITYYTGGTSTPSFTVSLQINGTNVVSCNGITVSSATRATTNCTSSNAITTGQHPTLVITGTSGTPSSSLVQINYRHSNP